jgi:osmotically-inducible protein OsmY
VVQADEEQRQAQVEAARRADEGRRRQAEAGAARRAEEERRRQAEVEAEAARQAEAERRRQAEVEAARQAEAERRRQAEVEATRRAEAERRRQAEVEAARQAEAEAARAQASPPLQIARPAEPAPAGPPLPTLSAQELARIRTQAEQRLFSSGLLRVSSDDRWGVALEIGSSGVVVLSGVLRDIALYHEAIRLVREVPGVQDVKAAGVQVSEIGTVSTAQSDSARIRAEIQQRLRSRGLLRESPADRWGVTVEVGAGGEVTLVGVVRDAGLPGEVVRLVQGVPGVRQVQQDIRVVAGAGRL